MDSKQYIKLASLLFSSLLYQNAFAVEKETLVVTATGFTQTIKNAPASISVITQAQLEDKTYRDITDALKDIPGVVVTNGGSYSDISIRGVGAQYTLILIDGKKVNTRGTRPNSDNSGIEQGWLPPLTSIERIEIIRGPMSSLYGSDAIGGVINIITKKGSTYANWQGALRTDVIFQENNRSGDTFQSDLLLSGPLIPQKLGIKFSGLLSRRAEDHIVKGYQEQRMRNGSLAMVFTPNDQHDIEFEFSRSLQDRNARPDHSIEKTICQKTRCRPNTPSYNHYARSVYALSHDGHYALGHSKSYIQYEESHNPKRTMRALNTTLNTQNQIEFGAHNINIGGQYSNEKIKDLGNRLGSANGINKLTRWSWALFAEDSWAITDAFSLTSGIRLDRDENYGSHWSPKLYGVWNLSPQWTLKSGISTGYRSPNLRQSSANWGQVTGGKSSDGVIVGNAHLQPEKSVSEEIALLWSNQQGIESSLTFFNTQFKDKITEVRRCNHRAEPACTLGNQTFDFISDRVNVDKANIHGLEFTFGWRIQQNLKLSTNYTWMRSEQKSGQFKGKPLNKLPTHMLNASIDWQIQPDLQLWTRVNYRGKTSEYLGRVTMQNSTPAYTFVDLGLTYQANNNLTTNFGIYNALNKDITSEKYNTVLDGRRYGLGLTYRF